MAVSCSSQFLAEVMAHLLIFDSSWAQTVGEERIVSHSDTFINLHSRIKKKLKSSLLTEYVIFEAHNLFCYLPIIERTFL